MYKVLNKKEISSFERKYPFILCDDIKDISLIEYNGVCEYLINNKYLFKIKGKSVL